jgi:hypothetical protein
MRSILLLLVILVTAVVVAIRILPSEAGAAGIDRTQGRVTIRATDSTWVRFSSV